jgi:antitoxin component of RelBE/YafQ-DinJ toxin-antitoxin module
MRKSFNTSIEENIQNNFKAECAKNGLQMNTVLEMFMKAYAEGKFKTEIQYETNNNKF